MDAEMTVTNPRPKHLLLFLLLFSFALTAAQKNYQGNQNELTMLRLIRKKWFPAGHSQFNQSFKKQRPAHQISRV